MRFDVPRVFIAGFCEIQQTGHFKYTCFRIFVIDTRFRIAVKQARLNPFKWCIGSHTSNIADVQVIIIFNLKLKTKPGIMLNNRIFIHFYGSIATYIFVIIVTYIRQRSYPYSDPPMQLSTGYDF
jgi:hypothetical protein